MVDQPLNRGEVGVARATYEGCHLSVSFAPGRPLGPAADPYSRRARVPGVCEYGGEAQGGPLRGYGPSASGLRDRLHELLRVLLAELVERKVPGAIKGTRNRRLQ